MFFFSFLHKFLGDTDISTLRIRIWDPLSYMLQAKKDDSITQNPVELELVPSGSIRKTHTHDLEKEDKSYTNV